MDAEKYLEECEIQFRLLIDKLPEKESEYWGNKSKAITQKFIEISNEVQKEQELYKRNGLSEIYAYNYLNSVYGFRLPKRTKLIDSLGSIVIKRSIGDFVLLKIASLEKSFNDFENTKEATSVVGAYQNFLNLKSEYERIKSSKDTLFYTIYEYKSSYYDTPDSIVTYLALDWGKQISKLNMISSGLEKVKGEIELTRFTKVKDPNPVFPVIFQICTLLVIVANSFMNFKFDQKLFKLFFGLVILSLMTSVVILFLNKETILNCIINTFVPGLTYLLYYNKEKKKSLSVTDRP